MNESDYDALSVRIWTPVLMLGAMGMGVGAGGVIGVTWGFEAALIAMAIVAGVSVLFAFISAVVLDIVREGYDVGGDADGR